MVRCAKRCLKKLLLKSNLNFDEIKDKSNFGYLRIMFTGNIGEAQSFETMIKAASILKKKVKVDWYYKLLTFITS